MRVSGLIISYKNGMNVLTGNSVTEYPVGDLLCRIFQGKTLDNITRILRNCINACPMRDNLLTQDEIEDAEHYIIQALLYDDFKPAQQLAQGSFIRCMECYRALDSRTAGQLLYQERARADESDMLFKAIGFDTVGDFLRLSYNNYIIDLYNALTLFTGMASVKSGTASPEEQATYDEIRQQLNNPDAVPGIEMRTAYDAGREEFSYSYVISSFLAMAVFEFSHLTIAATKVVRCHNPECRKFFTAKRINAKYCPFPAPQNSGRSCNDYYPQLAHRSKVKADALREMEKRAFCRLYNDKRRHPEATAEIEGLLRTLQIESPGRRDRVLIGALSEAEYQAWLNTIRREKGRSYDE